MNSDQDCTSLEYNFGEVCDYASDSCPSNDAQDESLWTRSSVNALLEECLKRQKEFHHPRHRRNKFFSAIRDSMLERGFVFNAKTLEKKFYNLKKHFFTISKNREHNPMPGKPIAWPFYAQMMQMFAEEMEIADAPTMASLYPEIPPKQVSARCANAEMQCQVNNYTDSELRYTNSDEESRWDHTTVMAFLDECCKRKHELLDPKIRRRSIFSDIRRRLKELGYFFHQESLDRKLRNMKKQFQVVSETMQRNMVNRCAKQRKVTWPYYEKLKELYGNEVDRDVRRREMLKAYEYSQSKKSPESALKFRRIAPKSAESRPFAPKSAESPTPASSTASQSSTDVVASPMKKEADLSVVNDSDAQPSTSSSHDRITPPAASISDSDRDAKHDDEKLKFIRQIVALEERRTVVAEQMLAEMIESNKIREKRLEFNRIKLEYVLRKKRKKNGSI